MFIDEKVFLQWYAVDDRRRGEKSKEDERRRQVNQFLLARKTVGSWFFTSTLDSRIPMVGLSLYPQPMARLTVFYCPWGNPNSDQEGSQGPPSVRYSRTLPIRRSSRRLPWKISASFPWIAFSLLWQTTVTLHREKGKRDLAISTSIVAEYRRNSTDSMGKLKLMATIVIVARWHSWQKNPYFHILQEGAKFSNRGLLWRERY